MARPPDSERDRRRSDTGPGEAAADPPAQLTTRVIAIGASAGGVEALRAVVAGLPADLPAAVLVVLHIPIRAPSALPGILDRAGPLPARAARHGGRIRPSMIYVAPADHHLLIRNGHLELSVGPTENGHRPAIDPLFRSAAVTYGASAIGVVLSGARDDGSAGLTEIVKQGGQAIVQDPEEALHRSMPASALEHVASAHVLPAAKIGARLGELTREHLPQFEQSGPSPQLDAENEIAALGPVTTDAVHSARPSGFSCPDCQGVLFELDGEPAPRYRCRVGHAWSPASLVADQTGTVEHSLWVALRTLEENAALNRQLAEVSERRERHRAAAHFQQRYESSRTEAAGLRELLGRITTALEGITDDEP